MEHYGHDNQSHRTDRSKGSECIQIASGRQDSKAMTRLLSTQRNSNRVAPRCFEITRFPAIDVKIHQEFHYWFNRIFHDTIKEIRTKNERSSVDV